MRRRFTRLSLALAFGLLLAGAQRVSACPNCKEAVANLPGEESNVAKGYNYSVLFMVSMPFTLLGTGAFFVTRAARRGIFPDL